VLNAPLGLYYYGLRGAFRMLLPKLKLRAERSNILWRFCEKTGEVRRWFGSRKEFIMSMP